jgi:hypothetical protein
MYHGLIIYTTCLSIHNFNTNIAVALLSSKSALLNNKFELWKLL